MYEEYVGKEMQLEEAAKLRYKITVCGIYSITNKVNGKVYVGQSKSIYARAIAHAKNRGSNEYLQRAIAKYNIENFVHKVELLCSKEELPVNEVAIFDKYKAAGTVMYNVAECGSGGNTMEHASEERKEEKSAKIKNTLANRTAEEKVAANAKISTKLKAAWASYTAGEIAERSVKLYFNLKTALANKTAEEVAQKNIKIKATHAAKYSNVVECTIRFCLKNNIYTFGKYKEFCIANNLELQVSNAYFDRIMKFATSKHQLAEFNSIYKDNMDYNTYTSLCKLKPITKEVYAVTVNYSTYKHF